MCPARAMALSEPQATPLSLTELALLEFTNGGVPPTTMGAATTYTTKDAYLWAALLAAVAEQNQNAEPEDVVDIYNESFTQVLPLVKDVFMNWDPFRKERADLAIAEAILGNVLKTLEVPSSVDHLKKSASGAYVGLVEKGLIDDPVVLPLGAAVIAVMGLVPIGFTQKTKRGEVVSQRIWGLFWEYERSSARGAHQHRMEFRLLEFIRAFSRVAIDGFANALTEVRRGNSRRG